MSSLPGFAFEDWFRQNIALLTEVLAHLKGKPGVQGLEIGCFEGRSTLWFMENILTGAGAELVSVDNFKGSHEHSAIDMQKVRANFEHNLKVFLRAVFTPQSSGLSGPLIPGTRSVRLYVEESRLVLKWLPEAAFDFVFVDGSHTACDVLSDLVLSWPLLKPGGVMVMDDYQWPGHDSNPLHRPQIAIDAFLNVFAEKLEVLHKEYSVAVRKL